MNEAEEGTTSNLPPRKRVMIFDDNAVLLNRYVRFMQVRGYEPVLVRIHTDKVEDAPWHQPASRDAIRALMIAQNPDVIVTDYDMHLDHGDLTGADILSIAREALPTVPVILSTNKISGIQSRMGCTSPEKFEDMGFNKVLGKTDVDGLEIAMRAILDQNQRTP